MFNTVILADDLSGAADCAVTCVHSGLDTLVALGGPSSDAVAEVLSIDADTRRMDAGAAASRMRSLTAAFAADPATLLFKKIDSTLRGHLGAELAAVLASRRIHAKDTVAVMAPALPAGGRTVRCGSAYIHGQLLHETELWRNQEMDGEAYIPAMLHKAGLTSTHIDLTLVRSPQLRDAVREAAARCDVLLCDSVTNADLEAIAIACRELSSGVVWVGSAGLACHLPYPQAAEKRAPSPQLQVGTPKPVLFVIGSMCGTARRQVAALRHLNGMHSVHLATDLLLNGQDSADWQRITAELQEAANCGMDLLLTPDATPVLPVADRPQLSRGLANMAAGLRYLVGALVACGGETARMVLDRWAVSGLRLLGEMESGVAVSKAIAADPELVVVTKAGDFGTEQTLVHCRHWLHAGKEIHL